MELSALELWLLARAAGGYEIPPTLPEGVDSEVSALLGAACRLEYRDREFLIRRTAPDRIWKAIQAVNTESPMPSATYVADQKWVIIPAGELKNLPPLKWIIQHEIPEESLVVIYGESGAGKSFIGLDYALRVAQTDPVLYIPTEGVGGYPKRVAAWCKHHGKSEGLLSILLDRGGFNLFERDNAEALIQDVLRIKPCIVFVDTLAMAMSGGDENSARDMGILLRACRTIVQKAKTTVVLMHHVGASTIRERGSTALRGNADVMIRVSPADDLILVECSKTKEEEPFAPRYLRLLPVMTAQGESVVPVLADRIIQDKNHLSKNQSTLLEIMALEVNADGVSMRDLNETTHVPLATIQRALSTMMRFGYVAKPGASYVITEEGRKVVKSDPGDPGDPGDPHKNGNSNFPDSGSRGSPGSPGSADHMEQQAFMQEVPRRSKNQYQTGH